MAAGRIVLPGYMPALDINGSPVAGAMLYVWENRTTDLASIFSDEGLTVAVANPVVADVAGQFDTVWADRGTASVPVLYSLGITDANGASIGNDSILDDWQPSAADAASESAAAAAAAAQQTAADVITTGNNADDAEAALAATLLAAVADGIWPTATDNVPRGITGTGAITAGSGGTNGTFAFSVTGGNFSVNPTGTFTVAGGALTAVTITGPGEYIGASPSVPTLVLTASSGLTGASCALTAGFLVASGRTWLADHASNASLWQVYQNVAGVATIKTGSTFVKAPITDPVPVYCEYVAASSWETSNKYFIRPISNIVPSGDLTGCRFIWEAPFDNASGDYGVHIVKYGVTPASNGTITAGQSITGNSSETTGNGGVINILSRDGLTAPAAGDISQFSLLMMRRNPAPVGNNPGTASAWRLLEASDRITAVQSKVVTCISETPQYPSDVRPFRGVKSEPNTILCDIFPHVDHYQGDEDPYHGDVDRFVLWDGGETFGLESAPTLNSHVVRRYDAVHSLWNMTVSGVDGGNPFNTGLSPSTAETVLNCGVQGGAAPELAGRNHGHETADVGAWDLRLTKNDPSTSDVDSVSANLATVPTNYIFEGDKLVSIWTGYMQAPGSVNAFKTTYTHTMASTSLSSVNVQIIADETDAGVTSNIVVRSGSYACMGPFRNVTRLRAMKVTPSTGVVTEYGPIIVVDKRDASTTLLNLNLAGGTETNWNAVEAWHHRRPLVRARLVNNAGPGFTHWVGAKIDANRVARRGPWFIIQQAWGTKAYDHIFADTTSAGELFTGVMRFDFTYYAVFGDDPEA
jgi:hypothetical protein